MSFGFWVGYRGFDVVAAFIDDVGVDHGCFQILMAEKFLDGSDIVAVLEQVRGEGMAECVAGYFFVDAC